MNAVLPHHVPILEARGIVKRLGGVDILKGVNFTVEEGSVVAIIGASGSGKSTLLRCLNMLIVPDDGEVLWQGRRIGWTQARNGTWVRQREPALLRYRTEVGMVFQNFNLFPQMTALDNIVEAPTTVLRRSRGTAIEEARALLAKVQLSHRSGAYPHQMSGGEQQRVAIARALAMRPKAMLFDEVTSALDPELKGEVLGVMRTLAGEGMTMLVVSHEMGFVRHVADRVIFMHKGVIREQGPSAEMLERPQSPELQAFLRRVTD